MLPEPEKCLVPLRVIVVGAGTSPKYKIGMQCSNEFYLGLGGLSTAISLARRGHQVVVLESTVELLAIGAGVALPPLTRRWFESEGVLELDDPTCVSLDGIQIARWDTDDLVVRTTANPVGKLNAIYHGDLQLALLSRAQQLENIEIRFGARVVDINVEDNVVFVATGDRVEGDLIIAADGVKSTIKHKICPPEACQAESTGEAAYRLTIPRQLLENDDELLSLVQCSWSHRWDGPGSHVVVYPVRNHQLLNVVLIHPDDGQGKESWTTVTEKHHVVTAFRAWNSKIHKLIDLAPAEVPNFRLFLYPPSPVWTKGSTILLGDACHAMLPYLGQGVAQAVEDAIAITTVLSTIKNKTQLPLATRAYEVSRKERVDRIQAASYQARQHLHLKDENAQKSRDLQRMAAAESQQNSDVVKMQHSYWMWDAAEAARSALSDIMLSADANGHQ
ncbi:hypothetical protein BP5796_12799 [Coleophoma crateriformis]|uniref:FAD-binding domain-containing protein n=1 Tax=Coleophoma crateriformis TaxID=565419 RepID=A0A3D8Q6B1_9HELO|nr:hypothetical protein BP5796_12799 [Coleophoma crateriformis]